jgi:hypothetical protein
VSQALVAAPKAVLAISGTKKALASDREGLDALMDS